MVEGHHMVANATLAGKFIRWNGTLFHKSDLESKRC